jgi:hypothetical protein
MYVQCICIHAMVRTMYVQCMNMVHAYYKYHPLECLHHGGIRESLKLHAQSKYMYCMYNVCTLYIHMTYTVWVCTSPFTYKAVKAHTVVCHNDMQEFGVIVSWHLKANGPEIEGVSFPCENPDIFTCTWLVLVHTHDIQWICMYMCGMELFLHGKLTPSISGPYYSILFFFEMSSVYRVNMSLHFKTSNSMNLCNMLYCSIIFSFRN